MDDGARHFARAVTHSGNLLRLRMVECHEDGIHITPHKAKQSTGKKVIYN